MRKVIAICDENRRYAERLADYISKRKVTNCEIWIFTDAQQLIDSMEKRKANLMLISESMYAEIEKHYEKNELAIDKTVCLTETKTNENMTTDDYIYKYQPASGILGKLLSECLDYGMEGYGINDRSTSDIIGIYSPIKRCLKTTFSFVLAQILSETYETLYMNFEGCSGFSELVSLDSSTNLADLIYDYSIYREEYPKRFFEYIQIVDGIGVIPPVETISEIQCVSTDDWISMLRRIKRNGTYEKIVMDVGDNANGIIELLRMCDVIYMPVRDDYISCAKLKSFENAIMKYDSSDLLSEKIKKISFPHFDDFGDQFLSMKYSQFGKYVRDIIQKY